MEIISTKKEGGSTFITVKISGSEGTSFLEKEESLADLLNEVGLLATEVLLSERESKKTYETPYGRLEVSRGVYQSSWGGKQYVPMEEEMGFVRLSTPRFAKTLSWKYAHLPIQNAGKNDYKKMIFNWLGRYRKRV